VVEDGDRVLLGVGPRDLDRVLDRLGAGVEQRRLLGVVTGGELGELLGDLDIAVVGRDHETGVGEPLHLVDHARGDLLGGVADRGHGDAGPHVDEGVAVGVDQHAAATGDDERGQTRRHAVGDVLLLGRQARLGLGAGDLGDKAALLGERGAADGCVGHEGQPKGQ